MLAPTSPGDVLDRMTILELKVARIPDPARAEVARRHHRALAEAWERHALPDRSTLPESIALTEVNTRLWEVEDALRRHEGRSSFGADFVALARSVYQLNDERARLKAAVDLKLGAAFPDVKGHGLGGG